MINFLSQDSVVGIEAVSMFAGMFPMYDLNQTVTISNSRTFNGSRVLEDQVTAVTLDQTNRLQTHTTVLNRIRTLVLQAQGDGCSLFQVTLRPSLIHFADIGVAPPCQVTGLLSR